MNPINKHKNYHYVDASCYNNGDKFIEDALKELHGFINKKNKKASKDRRDKIERRNKRINHLLNS